MPSSGDITAGRAGVQFFIDPTELKAGMKQAETDIAKSMKNIEKNTSAIRFGQITNSLGVGLQDFVTVLSQGGTMATAIGAVSNNLIQMASLINPMAGGAVAIGIALGQAAMAGYKMLNATKDNAKELEKARKEAEKLAQAKIEAAKATGVEMAKVREDAGDEEKSQKHHDKAVQEAKDRQAEQDEISRELKAVDDRSTNGDEVAEAKRLEEKHRLEKALAEANQATIAAREKVGRVDIERRQALETDEQKQARRDTINADMNLKIAQATRPNETVAERKARLDEAHAAVRAAREATIEANRRAKIDPYASPTARADSDKNSEKEQAAAMKQRQQEQEDADEKATADAEAIRKQYRTPDEKAQVERDRVEELYGLKKLDDNERTRALAQIERDRQDENQDLIDNPPMTKDQRKAKDIIENSLTPAQRKKKAQEEIDRLFGKGLMSNEEKEQALSSLDKAQQSVSGTFSSAALGGLGGSSPLDAIKSNTERAADATEELVKKLPKGVRKWEV